MRVPLPDSALLHSMGCDSLGVAVSCAYATTTYEYFTE